MTKYISYTAILVLLALVLGMVTTTVYASGDKVRGEKADGPAHQECESNDGDCEFTG